jgi:hypothetical protein
MRARAFMKKEGIACKLIYHGNGFMGIILAREEDETFEIGEKIVRHVKQFEEEYVTVFRHFFLDVADPRNGPYACLANSCDCGGVHPWDHKAGDCKGKKASA